MLERAADAPRRGGRDRRGDCPGRAARRGPGGLGHSGRARPSIYGVRNSQATVLAPTGTISFLMDCDTTGVEPDLGLVKTKKLVGGGTMSIVNQTVPPGARGVSATAESESGRDRRLHRRAPTILGAPHLKAEHLPVFAVLDGRQRHPLPRPREDARRCPAVHLGRHLQDGQHARGGDGRRRRAAAHRRLADGPQGRRDLPGQLQGRPAALDDQSTGGTVQQRRPVTIASAREARLSRRRLCSADRRARGCARSKARDRSGRHLADPAARASAARTPSPSGSPTARAMSPSASTRTAARARSS